MHKKDVIAIIGLTGVSLVFFGLFKIVGSAIGYILLGVFLIAVAVKADD